MQRMWLRTLAYALCALSVSLQTTPANAQHGAPANGEWPTYGGDLGSTKYSPLDQIDAHNFGDLEIVWRWESIDRMLSMTTPGGGEWQASSDLIFDALSEEDPVRWKNAAPPNVRNFKATPLRAGAS